MQIAIGMPIGYQAGAGGAVGIFDYLVKDEFTTDRSAGAIDGTPAEPGPGVRDVEDPNNYLTISSGDLVISSGASLWASGVNWGAVSTGRGRMLKAGYTRTSGIIALGWVADETDTADLGYITVRTAVRVKGATTFDVTGTISAADVVVIHRDPGYMVFVKLSGNWLLAYLGVDGVSATTNKPIIRNYNGVMSVHYFRVPALRWLPEPLVSDGFAAWGTSDGLGHPEGVAGGLGSGGNGVSWVSDYGTWTASAGRAYASVIDGIGVSIATVDVGDADYVLSCDVYDLAGVATSVIARWVDVDNHIVIRHTGSAVQLIKVVAGSATTLVNTAASYVDGATLRLVVEGTTFRAYYNDTDYGGAVTIADAALQSSTEVGLIASNTATRFDNFVVYARGSGGEYYSVLDAI